jgi:amicyanin
LDYSTSWCEHRLGRRRLLSVAGTAFVALALGPRVDAHNPTPTSAASDVRTKEATPIGSPVASPVASGPIFESTLYSLKFLPPEIDIEAGTTVVWTNNDVVVHTVTHRANVKDQLFSSPYLSPGQTFSYTFDKPGTYSIFCIPHPFMAQTVVVKEKS